MGGGRDAAWPGAGAGAPMALFDRRVSLAPWHKIASAHCPRLCLNMKEEGIGRCPSKVIHDISSYISMYMIGISLYEDIAGQRSGSGTKCIAQPAQFDFRTTVT